MTGRALGWALAWTLSGAVAGGGIGFAAFALTNVAMPRYTAEALYEVLPVPDPRGKDAALGEGGREEIDRFMETQRQVILSDRVLEVVANMPEVGATKWADAVAHENGIYSPTKAISALRDAVGASTEPETSLIRIAVTTSDPTDTGVIASTINEAFKRDVLQTATKRTQTLIDELQRKCREQRQEVAALDVRMENLLHEHGLTAPSIEQTTPYLERERVLSRLVEVRAKLAALPPAGEGREPDRERTTLEAVERAMNERLEAINAELNDAVVALTELSGLQEERAMRVDAIKQFEATLMDLRVTLDRGSRLRVVCEPAIPDEPTRGSAWPFVWGGASVLGVLGLLVGLIRPQGHPAPPMQADDLA